MSWRSQFKLLTALKQEVRHWEYLFGDRIGAMIRSLQAIWAYRRERVWPHFNWPYLWCGLVPVGYLILSGSGPNPYVCFPSMFGIILFLLHPWKSAGKLPAMAVGFLTLLTLWCWGQIFLESYARHLAGQAERPRAAMEAALTSLTQDAHARHLSRATVAIGYVAYWNAYAWQFMLVYLHGAKTTGDSAVVYQDIQYTPRFHYDWMDAVKSGTTAALDRSFGGIDYIYLLEPRALSIFEKIGRDVGARDASTPYIRDFEAIIRRRYTVVPVSPPITFSVFEQFRLYHLTPR